MLSDGPVDGIRRYTLEVLKTVAPLVQERHTDWRMFLSLDGVTTWPLESVSHLLEPEALKTLVNINHRENPTLISEVSRFANRMKRSVVKRLPFRREGFDLLHLPLPNSYSVHQHYNCQLVMTVHDLCHVVCPEFQVQKNIETLQRGLDHAIRRDAMFIADSDSTATELHDLENVSQERIKTVHLACDRTLFRPVSDQSEIERVREKYQLPNEPYIFSLCTLEPRKNLMGLVQAFRELTESDPQQNCHLVLAGRAGWGDQETILKAAASDRVHLIGRVDDEDLPVLYSQALAFACFSFYEGFCLPLLEAMTCGCPVLHADRSAMPEVAGGAGVAAAPNDPDMIFRKLQEVVNNEQLRHSMRQKSLARAEDFSWLKTAEQVLATYEKCFADQVPAVSKRKIAA
ncbi:MAG: glycosyltransferase family 4 protein [Planctomicrobium sp.]|nr:glycosyltransferase family 4 protein [Planctomicrobium sp.]